MNGFNINGNFSDIIMIEKINTDGRNRLSLKSLSFFTYKMFKMLLFICLSSQRKRRRL